MSDHVISETRAREIAAIEFIQEANIDRVSALIIFAADEAAAKVIKECTFEQWLEVHAKELSKNWKAELDRRTKRIAALRAAVGKEGR